MNRLSRTVRRLAKRWNRARYERVAAGLGLLPDDRVLELGCGRGDHSIALSNSSNDITGLDRLPITKITVDQPNFRYVSGDAADLSAFADKAFDVAMSFGMLEHVPDEHLLAVIRETQRVASRYCFVVPHRYGFLEPHFMLPFFALWPDRVKAWLVRRFPLGSQRRSQDGEWQRIQWLTKAQWRRLFADPQLRVIDHWYGPVLLDYLIFGGSPPPRPH